MHTMTPDEIQRKNDVLRKHLANLSDEGIKELKRKTKEEADEAEKDFQELKIKLEQGACSMCGNLISQFSERKPCFHWLLNPKGFKKKHFPLLYEKYSFHRLEAYLRWVANTDTPFRNINDLEDEKSLSKKIETSIKYRNLEWSFSCSNSDYQGHADRNQGKEPHYHFQMKVGGKVIINYNGFHVPFHNEDFLGFAMKDGEFPNVGHAHIHGAGMQAFFDVMDPEEIVDSMRRAENYDEATLHTSTFIEADPGTTISGSALADLFKEHKETGVSIAKLSKKLPNVRGMSIISPGPGVPDIAKRTTRKK